jgi:hypothetical protein
MAVVNTMTCARCGAQPAARDFDRATLHFDSDHRQSVYANLCRPCAEALVAWLVPPADVRDAWAARRLGIER